MPIPSPIPIHGEPDGSGIPNEVLDRQQQGRDNDSQIYDVDVVQKIAEVITKIKLRHRVEQMRRIRKWSQIIDFYHNRQWGTVIGGIDDGRWQPADTTAMPMEERVFFLSNNQVRPNIGTLAGVWSRSNPRILSEPAKESDQAEMMARYGSRLIDLYQENYLTEDIRQREAKLALLPGNWLCYQYFDPTGTGESIQVTPPGQPMTVNLSPDLLMCTRCGTTMPAPPQAMAQQPQGDLNLGQAGIPQISGQRCPKCGGPMIVKPGAKIQGEQPMQPVNIPIGEVFTELVNPAEICLELRARTISESMYLLRTRVLPLELLEHVFSWAKIPQTALSLVSIELKRLEVALGTKTDERSGGGVTISSGFAEDTELDEVWLDPPMYGRWRAKDDVQIGNVVVPRGSRVLEAFPEGLHAKYVDKEPLHYRPETKNDFWVLGKYDPASEAIWSDGAADDLIDPQIATNEAESLRMENLKENAVTHTLVNATHVDPDALDGFPDSVTALNSTGADVNPNAVWSQIPGSELRGVDVFLADKKADMRESSQAGAELAGNIQRNNRTMGGVQIARAQQQEQLGPRLAYRAYVETQRVKQMLKLKQANYVPGQYKDVLGDYSDLEEQAFIDGSVDRDIRIAAQDGSWLVRSIDQERQDVGGYLQLKAVAAQTYGGNVPEALEEWMQRAFNVPFSMEEANPDIRIAITRIYQAWSLVQNPRSLSMAGLQGIDPTKPPPDPMMKPIGPPDQNGQPTPVPTNPAYIAYANALNMLAAQIPVEVPIDDHPVFVMKYRSYLKTDRGRKAPPLFRQILMKKIEDHQNAMAIMQQQDAARQAPLAIKTAQVQGDLQADQTRKQAAAQPQEDSGE